MGSKNECRGTNLGGFLIKLFLSRRPHAPSNKSCLWDKRLERLHWRLPFALSGTLTYCFGLLIWANVRTGDFGPLILQEFFNLFGPILLLVSVIFSLIIAAQDRGGGPLRLFIQGVTLPAFVTGLVGISTALLFTFGGGILE